MQLEGTWAAITSISQGHRNPLRHCAVTVRILSLTRIAPTWLQFGNQTQAEAIKGDQGKSSEGQNSSQPAVASSQDFVPGTRTPVLQRKEKAPRSRGLLHTLLRNKHVSRAQRAELEGAEGGRGGCSKQAGLKSAGVLSDALIY